VPRHFLPLLAVAGVLLAGRPVLAAPPPAAKLVPNTTKEFIAVPSLARLEESLKKTQFGQLRDEPALKGLVDELRRLLNEHSELNHGFGVGLDDLKPAVGGEAAWALLQPAAGQDAAVLLFDATGKLDRAQALVEKARKKDKPRQVYAVLQDNFCVITDHKPTGEAVVARLGGGAKDGLADLAAYQAVMRRCEEPGKDAPHIRWFIEPLGRAELQAAA